MPNNRKITKKTVRGKEGLHPGSRKAGQLTRVQLRTAKLQNQTKHRKDASATKLHRPLFFLHSLTSAHPLSLRSLRALISEVYLTRYDLRIAELDNERRAGRPSSKEYTELVETRRREAAEWETGFEVPDLTHGPTTRLLYHLLETDTPMRSSHVDLLRQIRVIRDSDEVVLTKVGRTEHMGLGGVGAGVAQDGEDWTELRGADGHDSMEA
ncbi:MAG: hypothetical protein TREMPRED_003403 [Tremellales sp. Tagirdzhanova-0007]|nr:MAG: hypothetical protein TREMPRED_003403 [Tremellales sp. Tagirdzhanova-0007]